MQTKGAGVPLFNHRFSGSNAAGDVWIFGWWDVSSETQVAAQNARAVTWLNDLWAGPGGSDGLGSLTVTGTTATTVITGEIDETTGRQTRRADTAVTLSGDDVGPALPADVALVVSLRTALANRSGRGRMYLPQLATSQMTAAGRLQASAQTAVLDAVEFAWSGFVASGQPVVRSRVLGVNSPITSFDVGDLLDTQRRRENKVLQNRSSSPMP